MEREQYEHLSALGKEDLIRLIEIYSKNWLALDGVWFQSVERKRGMDEAMEHDAEAWRRFTVIEARRIKTFLGLPEHAGLEGLAAALRLRFYANLNTARIGRGGRYACLYDDRMPRADRPCAEGDALSPLQAGGVARIRAVRADDRRPYPLPLRKLLSRRDGPGLLLQMGVYAGRGG